MKTTNIKNVMYRKRDNRYLVSYINSNKHRSYGENEKLPKTVKQFILDNVKNVRVWEGLVIWE